MSDLRHECGLAAVCHLPGGGARPEPLSRMDKRQFSQLIPRMLLDIQNRGQLAAGMSVFMPEPPEEERPPSWDLLKTYVDVGGVNEVFRLSHKAKAKSLMDEHPGVAAIGHVRYATCGPEDKTFAQPFERRHLQRRKWFSFCFNGNLANYAKLRSEILSDPDNYLARDTDTEVILHLLSRELSENGQASLVDLCRAVNRQCDGAFSLVYLNGRGELLLARDPLGIKPLCWAQQGDLFAAASESVALTNLGFAASRIRDLAPGCALTVINGEVQETRFAEPRSPAHCFFEWIYFANVASTLDGQSVYVARKRLGEELAALELAAGFQPDDDTIVVPVPDTSKAAADAMGHALKTPVVEGLIRNRYSGRTFIEGSGRRSDKVAGKYTPLREVLLGKRVLLVEDSIVRATTMQSLVRRLKEAGGAREVHVRVACPPIVAPCFYGIDMSTLGELFAPRFIDSGPLGPADEAQMARQLGADSLRYLPVEAIGRAVSLGAGSLCQACITGKYPTDGGQERYEIELAKHRGVAPAGV
jgi:amidophosphoribosyltransferase